MSRTASKGPRVKKNQQLAYTTKTQALSKHLNTLARCLGPGAKLPISGETGIAVMTLNRALALRKARGVVMRRRSSRVHYVAVAPRITP